MEGAGGSERMTNVSLDSRPLLVTAPTGRRPAPPSQPPRGESARLPSRARQVERLTPRFDALLHSLEQDRSIVQTSLPAADPELVLVFETRGSVADVIGVMQRVGLRVLIEVEDEFDPDDDFEKNAKRPGLVPGRLHVAFGGLQAMQQLREAWGTWSRDEPLLGLGGRGSGLASLFSHLKDVRPWSPSDRVRSTGLEDAVRDWLEMQVTDVPIEAELWFADSAERRAEREAAVSDIIAQIGGRVLHSAVHEAFGYHALAALVPVRALEDVVTQGPDSIQLLRSHDVFFLRPGGQSVTPSEGELPGEEALGDEPMPMGEPTVLLLDGLPAANHARLDGRVIINDPDGFDDGTYEARLRRHGSEMASLIVWGDLGAGEAPLRRPIVARPILRPDRSTITAAETVPETVLLPDLMVRAFRELATGSPSVRIVNLSVCDPHAPFDTIPSAWARALDWLMVEHNVLVVVSAGNYPRLELEVERSLFESAQDEERRHWTLEALGNGANERRLLTPAESINAVTVGALHADAAGDFVSGNRIDPLAGALLPSPVSAIGRGFRRSVKPDMHAPGGRQLFNIDLTTSASTMLVSSQSALTPGLRAASPTAVNPSRGEVYLRGTSGATALATRQAAKLLEMIDDLRAGVPEFGDRHVPAALKALLVHGVEWPDPRPLRSLDGTLPLDRYLTYGHLSKDHTLDCPVNRVTVLAVGDLGAREEEDILLPLPEGLTGIRGRRRVTATLAWLSPINWRHRQYRRAKLSFSAPSGALKPVMSSKQVGAQRAQRGTVQHQIFEGVGAVPISDSDDLRLTVACLEQAGGLNGTSIPYAVAISLEVAPELGIEVYEEVAARLRQQVRVAPRP